MRAVFIKANLLDYERVSSVAGRTLAAIRRTKTSVRKNLNNWLVMSVFLLGLVSNVTEGEDTAWIDDIVFPIN